MKLFQTKKKPSFLSKMRSKFLTREELTDKRKEVAEKIYAVSEKGRYLPQFIANKHKKSLERRATKIYHKDPISKITYEVANDKDVTIYLKYAIHSSLLFKLSYENFLNNKDYEKEKIEIRHILDRLISIIFYTKNFSVNTDALTKDLVEELNLTIIQDPSEKYIKYFNVLYKSVVEFFNEFSEKRMEFYYKNMNDFSNKYSTGHNEKDFARYSFTPTDGEFFKVFGSWGFAAIGIGLTLVFLPFVGPVGIAVLAVAGPLVALGAYAGPKIKDLLFRSRRNYYIDGEKLTKRLEKLESADKKFNEMRDLIHNFNRLFANTDMFNFYFSNTFDYYVKLKQVNQTQLKKIISNKIIDDKEYKKVKKEMEFNYYKTLGYFRLKKSYQGNLKIQIEGLKEMTLKSVFLLRNDKDLISCIKTNQSNLLAYMKKFTNKLRKKKKMDFKMIDDLEDFLLKTLMTDNLLNKKENENLKKEINKLNAEYGVLLKQDSNASFKLMNRLDEDTQTSPVPLVVTVKNWITHTSPVTHDYVSDDKTNAQVFVDPGIFLISSVAESILFLSGSSCLGILESHKRVYKRIRQVASIVTLGRLTASIVMVVSREVGWKNLFETGMQHVYVNPFSIILSMISASIGKVLDKNYLLYWSEMHDVIFKNDLKDPDISKDPEKAAYPIYTYFTERFKSSPLNPIGESPMSAVTRMSNVFRDKFLYISTQLDEINRSSKHLCKSIAEKMKKKEMKSEKYYDIFEKYAEVILRILSICREVQELDFCLQTVYSFDKEIENTLKLYSSLILFETKEVFALSYFQNDRKIESYCELSPVTVFPD